MKQVSLASAALLLGLAFLPGPAHAAGDAEEPSIYMRTGDRALLPQPPRGYTRVWTDGRLNPRRGPRTARGDAAMHGIWSEDTPMQLRILEDDRR